MDPTLERLQAAIVSSTRNMTTAELTHHPEGKWSAAEILEHLYLTYTGTVKAFQRCLEAGQPKISPSTLKQRIALAVTVGAGYMPRGRIAPKHTVPRGAPPEKILAEIGDKIRAMDEIIAQCEHRFGGNAKLLDHPILGALTGKQWRKFHYVHGRHHVRQIARLRSSVET